MHHLAAFEPRALDPHTPTSEAVRRLVERGPSPHEYPAVHSWIAAAVSLPEAADYIQEVLRPTLVTDCVHGHALLRPHGYAGDFELMDRLYREWESRDPHLARWDRFCHAQPAARAVRNRKKLFLQLLGELDRSSLPHPKVLNLASGPGRDVAEHFERHPDSRVHVHSVELDRSAIEYAARLCRPAQDRVSFERENALKYRPPHHAFDLAWCAGLMDYVSDRAFVAITRRLYDGVKPGGRLVVGNFSPDNPSRSYMEVFSNWVLIHRTDAELLDLAHRAGLPEGYTSVERESTGVNLFLTTQKPRE